MEKITKDQFLQELSEYDFEKSCNTVIKNTIIKIAVNHEWVLPSVYEVIENKINSLIDKGVFSRNQLMEIRELTREAARENAKHNQSIY